METKIIVIEDVVIRFQFKNMKEIKVFQSPLNNGFGTSLTGNVREVAAFIKMDAAELLEYLIDTPAQAEQPEAISE